MFCSFLLSGNLFFFFFFLFFLSPSPANTNFLLSFFLFFFTPHSFQQGGEIDSEIKKSKGVQQNRRTDIQLLVLNPVIYLLSDNRQKDCDGIVLSLDALQVTSKGDNISVKAYQFQARSAQLNDIAATSYPLIRPVEFFFKSVGVGSSRLALDNCSNIVANPQLSPLPLLLLLLHSGLCDPGHGGGRFQN